MAAREKRKPELLAPAGTLPVFEQAIEATVKWYIEHEEWWRKIKSGTHYQAYYERQYAGRAIG